MIYLLNQFEAKSGNALKDTVRNLLGHKSAEGDNLRRYIMAVLDPMITYGVKGKLKSGAGALGFDENAYTILDRLAARTLTGNAAKDTLELFCEFHTPDAVELMNRALNKDLRCGVGIALINDLQIEGFKIPVFECQLAQPGESKRMKDDERWLGCIKYDGMRSLIEVNDNRVNFWTRSGKPITALEPLAPAVLEIFGGERLMLDSEGVGTDFLDTVSQLRKKTGADLKDSTVLQVFDMVDLDDFRNADNRTYFGGPLTERLTRLAFKFIEAGRPVGAVQQVEHREILAWSHAVEMADSWMALGLEGGIFKRASAGYIKRRTHDWLKIKLEDEITAKVIGIYEGEAGKQFEGMMGGVKILVEGVASDVGGGWTPAQRASFWSDSSQVVGRLIDVKCNGKTPSGALRHARFERFRDIDGAIA
jgi:DNA ligase-1